MPGSKTFVALLRGINVGGKSLVPMAELRTLLTSLGFEDVVTYIQSGNVVFRSSIADEVKVAAKLEQEIAAAFAIASHPLLTTPVPSFTRTTGPLIPEAVSAGPNAARPTP